MHGKTDKQFKMNPHLILRRISSFFISPGPYSRVPDPDTLHSQTAERIARLTSTVLVKVRQAVIIEMVLV